MTGSESFIAAMVANPEDDTPRLAYADWLEERGDTARAEFIRDQLRVAKATPGTAEFLELFRRTATTLRANLPAWIEDACNAFDQSTAWEPVRSRRGRLTIGLTQAASPKSPTPNPGLTRVSFERGFLEDVRVVLNTAGGRSLERILREHPISRLTLTITSEDFRPEYAVAPLNQIHALTVTNRFKRDEFAKLFQLMSWDSLKNLAFTSLALRAVPALRIAPIAKRLQGLKLAFTSDNLADLAQYPLDDSLRTLRLFDPDPPGPPIEKRPALVAQLSGVAFRPTLKYLSLAGCRLGDAGLATFARGDVWIRLRSLALDHNRFGDPGWRDFVRGRRTPELSALSASRNFLTDDGAIKLGESPLVQTLEFIDLRGNRIGGKGAMALARRLADGPARRVLLAGNRVSDAEAHSVRRLLGSRVDIGDY